MINNSPPLTLSNGNVMIPFWEGSSPYSGKFAYVRNPALNPYDLDQDGDVDGYDLALLILGYESEYDADDLQNFPGQYGY